VTLKKEGEDQFDWSCEKWRSITKGQEGEKNPKLNKIKEC